MNMADTDETEGEGEVLELETEQIVPDEGEEVKSEGDDEEVIISIGDEVSPASSEDNATIRQMREALRAKEDRIKELERGTEAKPVEIGPKPTLESCDYDEERFETQLDDWKAETARQEQAKTEAQKARDAAQERWNGKLAEYGSQKTNLAVKGFDAAEAVVKSALSEVQQSVLIAGATNKALLVLALGSNPAKLDELAKIQDPIEFAFAAARLEGQTKMERRPATTPEGRVKSSAPLKQMDKLDDRMPADQWMKARNAQLRKK